MPRVSFGLSATTLLLVGLEPGELDLQVVGAREQPRRGTGRGRRVTAVAARLRARVRQRDGRAGEHAAAGVLDRATDRGGGRGLGEGCGAESKEGPDRSGHPLASSASRLAI